MRNRDVLILVTTVFILLLALCSLSEGVVIDIGELSMGWVITHNRNGVLADFDPFGKQEFTWSTNPCHAWVFRTYSAARIARNALPRYMHSHVQIIDYNKDTHKGA